ncbi:SGNH/GDSL hydrolase family protein [Actinacidiphila guanduensis]|uniref:SGNH/GDSL hydrolase family protein n=1 Tax=Actinacidiphila guanduensis TaxID=310781 RepID=UPI002244FC50|nr:SGNH/GDSL hydrolase family protein [Actinacidiphila guanduensis]
MKSSSRRPGTQPGAQPHARPHRTTPRPRNRAARALLTACLAGATLLGGTLGLAGTAHANTTNTVTTANPAGPAATPSTTATATADPATPARTSPRPHPLSTAFDNTAITDNAAPTAGDFDGVGNTLSAQDLAAAGWGPGAHITLDDTRFTWPDVAPGQPDNVISDGQTIALTGSGTALGFLVTGTHGATSGTGTITYTDGSRQSFTLGGQDWISGPTDTMAVALPHWNTPSGTVAAPPKLYAVSVPITAGRHLASVTLPQISDPAAPEAPALHVFAVGVRPSAPQWAGTWAAAADDSLVNGPWTNRTLRMVEHTSIGGSQIRIRLDNAFAPSPVTVAHATIAVRGQGSAAAATPRTLTFGGARQTTIPAGGQAVSDSVAFHVPADSDLLVSLFLPGPVHLASMHSLGMQDNYSSADQAGDRTQDVADFPVNNTFGFWTLLSGIDVRPAHRQGTVVAFGDSITDGYNSTYNGNDRWPNDLARRLLAQGGGKPVPGVIDEGISGNRVVTDRFTGVAGTGTAGISALARLDRDLLAQPNVRTVVLLEGINDIDGNTPADQVIAGLTQIAQRAHAAGIRVVAATLTPFEHCSDYTPARETQREAVNSFIRDNGGVFDSVVDFDKVTQDPADPLEFLPAYDSGDHLHPGPAGYQAMADAIDLATL